MQKRKQPGGGSNVGPLILGRGGKGGILSHNRGEREKIPLEGGVIAGKQPRPGLTSIAKRRTFRTGTFAKRAGRSIAPRS